MAIMSRLILAATLVWLLVSLYFMLKPEVQKYRRRRGFASDWTSFQSDWKRLVLLCHGDEERARRLMHYEKRGNPGIDDREACQRASERYHRDNS
ncbi:hypothetical protein HUU05_01905 [candidate division KSB1 bacterium]|nr:hypothetical protein [candidate division KSB1 bacterium]